MNKPKPGPGGKVNTPDYYHYYYSQPLNGPATSYTPTTATAAAQSSTSTPSSTNVSRSSDVKAIALDTLNFTKEMIKRKIFYKVLAWLFAYWFFIKIEFGAVFFVVTGFALIYFNLGERKKGEQSAYNVFNKNHRELLGTFNAQQFEDQMMSRNSG